MKRLSRLLTSNPRLFPATKLLRPAMAYMPPASASKVFDGSICDAKLTHVTNRCYSGITDLFDENDFKTCLNANPIAVVVFSTASVRESVDKITSTADRMQIPLFTIDTLRNSVISEAAHIITVPTAIVYSNGVEVSRMEGELVPTALANALKIVKMHHKEGYLEAEIKENKILRKPTTAPLLFYLNGQRKSLPVADPEQTLLSWLRTNGYTGPKAVCEEGGCGACAVIVSKWDPVTQSIQHKHINSCMTALPMVDHTSITTVESLAPNSTRTMCKGKGQATLEDLSTLHPIQRAICTNYATQCGYCTPGFVMSMLGARLNGKASTQKDIENALDGNICRCTGYATILNAAKDVISSENKEETLNFPKELEFPGPKNLTPFIGEKSLWYRPTTLESLLHLKHSHPHAIIVCGNTDVGYRHITSDEYIGVQNVAELNQVTELPNGTIRIGAATRIEDVKEILGSREDPGSIAIREQLSYFANTGVRSSASLAGSVVTCSHLGDLLPVLTAADASVIKQRLGSPPVVIPLTEWVDKTTHGPRIDKDEVVIAIDIPALSDDNHIHRYKHGRRRVDSISMASAGFRVSVDENDRVKEAVLVFGGLGIPGQRATIVEQFLKGKQWVPETLEAALQIMRDKQIAELIHDKLPPRLQIYQGTVVQGFLVKYFLTVLDKIHPGSIPERLRSAYGHYPHPGHSNTVDYDESPGSVSVGKGYIHINSVGQVTGTSRFTSDINGPSGTLHGCVVTSKSAHGKFRIVDTSAALSAPGVKNFYSREDIPGSNSSGFRQLDEQVFAEESVHWYGQPIGLIVADTEEHARNAAELIQIEYQNLPPIVTIEQAISANSYHEKYRDRVLERGDWRSAMDSNDPNRIVVEGDFSMGGQAAWYLEAINCIAEPQINGSMIVTASTQSPSNVQQVVAAALGTRTGEVEVRVPQVGGGFGGKQLRVGLIAAMAAVAAKKENTAVKLMLNRTQNQEINGGRSPVKGKYKVAADKATGKLLGLDVEFYGQGGWFLDYSGDILETILYVLDSAYHLPAFRATGHLVKCHHHPYTATRGFGKPEASAIIETIIDRVAFETGLDGLVVRTNNLMKQGDKSITGTLVGDSALQRVWTEVQQYSNYQQLRKEVEEFNKQNRWRKRGLSIIPSKGNFGFVDCPDVDRGIAAVHLHPDGTLVVSHSGCEMGQGLNTRLTQIAADSIPGLSIEKVRVSQTTTEQIIGAPPTTMVSTDLIGRAIVQACNVLNERLAPYFEKAKKLTDDPHKQLEISTKGAWDDGVILSSHGQCFSPGLYYDWKKQQGEISFFFVFGSSVSVVEIDCLTGSSRILKTELVQDCGHSLNPPIDIGQIEGGFIYGLGLYTMEEDLWLPSGKELSTNLSSYKLPSHDDLPAEWNVHILKNSPSRDGIFHSMSIGEANVQQGLSVYFAILDAVRAARKEVNANEYSYLPIPSTWDRIRENIPDELNLAKLRVDNLGKVFEI